MRNNTQEKSLSQELYFSSFFDI